MQAGFIVSGIPGAGKTTVAHELARRLPRAAHIESDAIGALVVSGRVEPGEEPSAEADRQLALRRRNVVHLANELAAAGFVPVVDDVVVSSDVLDRYRAGLAVSPLHLVVLAPAVGVALARDAVRHKQVAARWTHLDVVQRERLSGVGLWLDTGRLTPAAVVDQILARREEAVL